MPLTYTNIRRKRRKCVNGGSFCGLESVLCNNNPTVEPWYSGAVREGARLQLVFEPGAC